MGAGVQNQVAFGNANPNEAVNQQVLLELLQGDRVQLADAITADQQDLDVKTQQLKASGTQLEARKGQQAKVVSQLESSVNRQQELLDSTKGELRAAVEAEQERAAAAAAAAAKAQAAAQAQRQATQGQPTDRVAPKPGPANPPARAAAAAPTSSPQEVAAPAEAPLPASAPRSGAAGAIAAAQSQLGTPYRYGGSSPGGFDCSGLMLWSWAQVGVSLPRTSGAQRAGTQRITREQLQPGDLVFYRNPVGHVGMYIGGGQMVHSPHTGDVVKISPIDRMGGSMSFGRVG